MPDTSSVRTQINSYFTTNGAGSISGSMAKTVLLAICDLVDGIFTTFLKVGTNTTSTNNGDDVYHTGKLIVGRTTDDGSGQVLQTTSMRVDSKISFTNTVQPRRIVLYGDNNDNQFFGFGLLSSAIRFQVDGVASNFVFFAGINPTTSNELMRLTGGALLGVGTSTPSARLHAQSPAGYQQLRLETPYTPTGSSDPAGDPGSICWDANYLYVKTAVGAWKRTALSTF